MANTHTTLTSLFTDIADAIREKKKTTGTIVADNFPSEIRSISGGGLELSDEYVEFTRGYNYSGYDENYQELIANSNPFGFVMSNPGSNSTAALGDTFVIYSIETSTGQLGSLLFIQVYAANADATTRKFRYIGEYRLHLHRDDQIAYSYNNTVYHTMSYPIANTNITSSRIQFGIFNSWLYGIQSSAYKIVMRRVTNATDLLNSVSEKFAI